MGSASPTAVVLGSTGGLASSARPRGSPKRLPQEARHGQNTQSPSPRRLDYIDPPGASQGPLDTRAPSVRTETMEAEARRRLQEARIKVGINPVLLPNARVMDA